MQLTNLKDSRLRAKSLSMSQNIVKQNQSNSTLLHKLKDLSQFVEHLNSDNREKKKEVSLLSETILQQFLEEKKQTQIKTNNQKTIVNASLVNNAEHRMVTIYQDIMANSTIKQENYPSRQQSPQKVLINKIPKPELNLSRVNQDLIQRENYNQEAINNIYRRQESYHNIPQPNRQLSQTILKPMISTLCNQTYLKNLSYSYLYRQKVQNQPQPQNSFDTPQKTKIFH